MFFEPTEQNFQTDSRAVPGVGVDGVREEEQRLKRRHPQRRHQVRLVRFQEGQVDQQLEGNRGKIKFLLSGQRLNGKI